MSLRGSLTGVLRHIQDKYSSPGLKSDAPTDVKQTKREVPDAPLPVESPKIQMLLRRMFESEEWPVLKEYLMMQIISYQTRTSKQLQGALGDAADVNGRRSSFLGGKLQAGDEIRALIETMKSQFTKTT